MLTTDLVSRFYTSVLQREGTEAELAEYTTQIQTHQTTTWAVLNALINSEEATQFVDPVIRLYYAGLKRQPDVAGIDHWADNLRDGSASLLQIAQGFVGSQEWLNTYGATDTTDEVIGALYKNVLLRDGSADEIAAWKATGLSTAEILIGFSESSEFRSKAEGHIDAAKGDAGKYATSVYGWSAAHDPLTVAVDYIAPISMTPDDLA
ncbi:DUF4214 domain-containing protein [Pannonibacter sp. SL95]|uniref:DUF4214 domain-containing protein n=1 Tax=Pannonibacter sp. SL95 TaxID=2995153 RepID=UPI002274A48E|nr:DUF4214 domain-containing protein [Pannonibacter sp. SL95]MCY1708350.1 DUF4214 domain-containing protein [Pannonibacter sp. SL95]